MAGEPFVPKTWDPSDPNSGLAETMWHNVTHGQGAMGLVSTDGTVAGALGEAANVYTPGASNFANTVGGPTAEAQGVVEPGKMPIVPPGTEGSDDFTQAALAESEYNKLVYGLTPRRPVGPGNEVMPEAVDWNPAGPEGKADFRKAFVEDPKEVQAAIARGAESEADKNRALAKHFTQEASRQQLAQGAIQARRLEDDQQQQRRQSELDRAVSFYSNDLANNNKFWSNPGNVISAIAFSLMPIGGGDPATGARLIQQSLSQDMSNRQKLADMHLGELRSNLGEYRKLAGDRRVGDLMAESEAQRIAAMEIQRIGADFASPIAKAKAEVLSKDFAMRAVQSKMQAFQLLNLYQAPKAVDPRVAAAYRNAGPGGQTSFAKMQGDMDVGPGAVKGTLPVAGTPGTPTTARGPVTPTQGVMGPDGAPGPTTAPKPATFMLSDILKSRGLSSPEQLLRQQAMDVANEAASVSKPGADPADAIQKIMQKDNEDIGKIATLAKDAIPHVVGSRRMSRDIALIQQAMHDQGRDGQDFIGLLRAGTSGPFGSWVRSRELAFSKANPSSPEAKKYRDTLEAQQRFHQLLAGEVVEYYHAKFGSAQNPSESAKGAQVITTASSWSEIVNWNTARSQDSQAAYTAALSAGGNPRAATRFQLRIGIGNPTLARQGATP